MGKKIICTDEAPTPVGPYSQAVAIGDFIFCSGQISLVPKTGELILSDIQTQTRQVMKNIEAVLRAGGLNMSHVVKSMIFLSSMDDFSAVNEIYSEYFPVDPPARSCVAVAGLPKGVGVEIEVIAKKD